MTGRRRLVLAGCWVLPPLLIWWDQMRGRRRGGYTL